MLAEHEIAVIGVGAMGGSLVRALAADRSVSPASVRIYDVRKPVARALARETGVRLCASLDECVRDADVILLCVKPGQMADCLNDLKPLVTGKELFISVAAGVRTTAIEDALPPNSAVVRVMPNIASTVGEAASALSAGRHVGAAQMKLARAIFEAAGVALEVEEKLLDAVTGLSGSGIAYVFMFIEALADGGVRGGLPRPLAMALAAQTVIGAGRMVRDLRRHPGELKDSVCSPAGTTIEAVAALEARGFRGAVIEAVTAATRRCRELGG